MCCNEFYIASKAVMQHGSSTLHDVSEIRVLLVRQIQERQLRALSLVLDDRHLPSLVLPVQDCVQRNGGHDGDAVAVDQSVNVKLPQPTALETTDGRGREGRRWGYVHHMMSPSQSSG